MCILSLKSFNSESKQVLKGRRASPSTVIPLLLLLLFLVRFTCRCYTHFPCHFTCLSFSQEILCLLILFCPHETHLYFIPESISQLRMKSMQQFSLTKNL